MPLKIEVNSTQANVAVKKLDLKFGDLLVKINNIKKAFDSINLRKFSTAKDEVLKLQKALQDSSKNVTSLEKQNKALSEQISLLLKAQKSVEKLTIAKKATKKSTEAMSSADKELEKVRLKAVAATGKLTAMNRNAGIEYSKYIKQIERAAIKIEFRRQMEKSLLVQTNATVAKEIRLTAVARETISAYEKYAESLAKLKIAKKTISDASAKQREQTNLELEATQKLIKIQSQLAFANSKTGKELQALIRAEEKRLDVLRRSVDRVTDVRKAYAQATEEERKRQLAIKIGTKETDKFTNSERKRTTALRESTKATSTATIKNKEFSRSLSSGNKHAAEFRAALSAMGVSFGIFTGSTIVAAASVFAIVKAIRSTIEAGAEFEFTMDRVNAVMNTTGSEGAALEEKVRSLAETTIFTAGEVSKGLVFLGMAGFNTAEAMQALQPTLRLAQIGMIDMERAADLVTNIMAGFDIKAHDVSATVDKLSVVVTSSNVSITQLAQSLSLVGPAAANTNTTLEDTTAIIGFFGNVGIKATRAGTALRRGIANLANPTDKVGVVMNKLNVTISDSDGRMRSMVEIMTDMSKAGATMSDIFEVFGVRAGPAFASAIISGTDGIKDLVAAQQAATDTSEALASVLADNAYTDFKLVISAAHEILISFYANIDGPLRNALTGLKNIFQAIAPLMGGFGTLLVIAATAATALGAALLLMKLGTFATGLAVASTAVGFMGNTMVGTTGYTNLMTAAMVRLKAVMAFFNPVLTLITGALTLLGLAYIYSETEAEKLTNTLKEQQKVLEDIDKLRLEAGVEKYAEGAGELDKALQSLQALKDAEGPTIGDRLADSLVTMGNVTEVLDKKLKTLKTTFALASNEKGKFYAPNSLAGIRDEIETTEKLIENNKVKGNVISTTRKEFERIGKLLNIENVLTLTATQLHKKVIDQKRLEETLQKELTREQREAIAGAAKENAIVEARKGLQEAIFGTRKDQIKLDEKARKEALKPLFKDLKDGVGDQDKIVNEILSVINSRQIEIDKVTAEANALRDAYEGSIDVFQQGTRQIDQLATSVVTEDLEAIREKFARISALKLQNNKDLSKLDQTQVENGIQAAQKAHDRGITAIKILNDKSLNEVKKQTTREQDELDFRFSLGLIKLKDYADQTVGINNRIIQENINGLERQKAVENARLATLSELKVKLSEQGFETQFLNGMIITQTEVVAKLNTGIETLNNTMQGSSDATGISLAALRGWVSEGTKANTKLEQQLDLLQKGASATKDMTQQMYAKAIADAEAAQTTGIHSESMKELLVTLQSLSSAYDLNKAKINELEEAWDDTTLNMKGQAKRAAESMHGAFVTFFTDPSKDALDDLLKHFSMTIQKMLAEKLAAQLFSNEGGGAGNWLTQLFGFGAALANSGSTGAFSNDSLFGAGNSAPTFTMPEFATGGSFRVKGSGGIDSELVQFRATPGERVNISNPNGGDDRKAERGGQTTNFNNTVIIEGNSSNKEEVRAMVDSSLNALEAKMIRQQQRTQRPMGIR